jgi:hypothetical protein
MKSKTSSNGKTKPVISASSGKEKKPENDKILAINMNRMAIPRSTSKNLIR